MKAAGKRQARSGMSGSSVYSDRNIMGMLDLCNLPGIPTLHQRNGQPRAGYPMSHRPTRFLVAPLERATPERQVWGGSFVLRHGHSLARFRVPNSLTPKP